MQGNLNLSLQKLLTHFYYRWHALEAELDDGIEVIDFDLCPTEFTANIGRPFNDRRSALKELDQLSSKVEVAPDSDFVNRDFIRSKLRGSHATLRVLLGEKIPFGDLLFETMGIRPEHRIESEWDTLRKRIVSALKELGVDTENESREEIIRRLDEADLSRFVRDLPDAAKFWVSLINKELELPYDPKYRIEIVEVDSYWLNWISKKANEPILLKVNTHPRNPFKLGDEYYMASHEIGGHAVQSASLEKLGRGGFVDVPALLTTVHTAEQFQFEGLAMSIQLLLQGEKEPSKWATVRALTGALGMGLANEAQLRLHSGEDMNAAIKFILDRHPTWPEHSIRADLKERMAKPLMGVYQYVYYPGFSAFMQLLNVERLVRNKFLKEFYFGLFTPNQIYSKLKEI